MVVVVHGGGILTADRIKRGRQEGFLNGAVRLTDEEINELLKEKIEGRTIPVYSYDDFVGKTSIPANYGIVLDFELAKNTTSDYHSLDKLERNPLFVARAGGVQLAREYLKSVAQVYDCQIYGNWHSFKNIDANKPQGRLVYLCYDNNGLGGNDSISNSGRFVGVQTPKVHGALKSHS